jgi:hypothetical protein
MLRRMLSGRRLRFRLGAVLLIAALLAAAKIHACACTGGPPVWHTVYPTSEP